MGMDKRQRIQAKGTDERAARRANRDSTPDVGLREAFYKASDGIESLMTISEKIRDADPEFARRVEDLRKANVRLLIWMNEKYKWD